MQYLDCNTLIAPFLILSSLCNSVFRDNSTVHTLVIRFKNLYNNYLYIIDIANSNWNWNKIILENIINSIKKQIILIVNINLSYYNKNLIFV